MYYHIYVYIYIYIYIQHICLYYVQCVYTALDYDYTTV